MRRTAWLTPLIFAGATLAACGGSTDTSSDDTTRATVAAAPTASGLRLVSAEDANAALVDAPDDLVILDVRTPEEFAEGHIDGAVMIDFYRDDFATELAKLDPDASYVLYCRSGNRSGQTLELMEGLEFQNVQDVDGGIVAWQSAGLPLTTP